MSACRRRRHGVLVVAMGLPHHRQRGVPLPHRC